MKVYCPACDTIVPVANVDLRAGWGKCSQCNDVFSLADVLDGYVPPMSGEPSELIEKPFDAWAKVDRSDDYLAIHIPAHGMRIATWGMLGFATLWLAFIAFWTAGALGVFFNQGKQIDTESILFACFSIPFWLVGFGMLGAVLWKSRGTRSIYMDARTFLIEWTCLFLRRRKLIERPRVQHARSTTKRSQFENGVISEQLVVEIVFDKGSFAMPCETPSEQNWLVAAINEFMKQVPARDDVYGHGPYALTEDRLRRVKRDETESDPEFLR